jgi:hypothetical protein
MNLAVASVFSVIRNCSVPFGISTPGKENIASTRWRTVADQKNKVYYFESALTPNTFWIDFKNINFLHGEKRRRHRGPQSLVLIIVIYDRKMFMPTWLTAGDFLSDRCIYETFSLWFSVSSPFFSV